MSGNLPIDGNKQTPKTGFQAGISAGLQKNGGKIMPNSVVQFGMQNGNTTGHIDIGYGGNAGMTSFGAGVEQDIDLGKGFSLELSADARAGIKNKPDIYELDVTTTNLEHNTIAHVEDQEKDYPKNFKAEVKVMGQYQLTENLNVGLGAKGSYERYTSRDVQVNTMTSRNMAIADLSSTRKENTNFSASPVLEANLDVGKNKNTKITASAAQDDVHLGVTHKFGNNKKTSKAPEAEDNQTYRLE